MPGADAPDERGVMRVLIADDEPGTRLLLAATLERLGHECLQAADGDEALDLYRRHAPQGIINDWEMPALDGPELARRVRAEPDIAYAYVIVLTGRADEPAA